MSDMPRFSSHEPGRRTLPAQSGGFMVLDRPDMVKDLLHPFFVDQTRELLRALFLDAEGRLCGMGVWQGEEDHINLPTRRIMSAALAADAHGIILAHNHPSGCPNPGVQDVRTTRDLARICAPLGIKLLDHVIIAGGTATSMKELRLI